MGNSMFDQLKKSGLIDKTKAQKAKHSQYKNQKQKARKGAAKELDESKLLAQQAHNEKISRDRQLNQQQREEAERHAITAQIRQLIETNAINNHDGDIAYNFTDNNLIKRLYVSEQIHCHLTSGRLAIAKLDDGYKLVPTPVAEKIRQRDTHCIIESVQQDESDSDDDLYADYKIPDDLMW